MKAPILSGEQSNSSLGTLEQQISGSLSESSSSDPLLLFAPILERIGDTNTGIIKVQTTCNNLFRMNKRSFKINLLERDEENDEIEKLLFTATQETRPNSNGYMLIFRNEAGQIFGSLGYAIERDCCPINFGEFCKCSTNFMSNCCKDGGCFIGGCFTQGGCFCCCDKPIFENGCCTFCNCFCFDGGACKQPICENGFMSCPDFKNIMFDIRLLNNLNDAFSYKGGTYVNTIMIPIACHGNYYDYVKAGEKYELRDLCMSSNHYDLEVHDKSDDQPTGNVNYKRPIFGGEEFAEIDFPAVATPMEKFLIIAEILCLDYNKSISCCKDDLLISRRRKYEQGLDQNFK